jgi:hypothetical protein
VTLCRAERWPWVQPSLWEPKRAQQLLGPWESQWARPWELHSSVLGLLRWELRWWELQSSGARITGALGGALRQVVSLPMVGFWRLLRQNLVAFVLVRALCDLVTRPRMVCSVVGRRGSRPRAG